MSTLAIATWGGPGHVAGLLLRAWGNRPDTVVWDEPFLPCGTARGTPGALAPGKSVLYRKHTTAYLPANFDLRDLDGAISCFLICDPRWMLQELAARGLAARAEETGVVRQVELFHAASEASRSTPIVIDADDLLDDPRAMLTRLCDALGLGFSESMLAWAAGPRDTDADASPLLYRQLERSTGFEAFRPTQATLGGEMMNAYLACLEPYRYLYKQRLRSSG